MPGLKKPSMRDDPAGRVLRQCSKQALVDLALDLIALDGTASCDDPITEERALRHLRPVLERRGDRLPKPRP